MPNPNRQWRLVSYPEGMPTESNWAMLESPIPEPGDGEMLVRAIYLDVPPGMRARILGFLVLDYQQRYQQAWARLANWHRAGALK